MAKARGFRLFDKISYLEYIDKRNESVEIELLYKANDLFKDGVAKDDEHIKKNDQQMICYEMFKYAKRVIKSRWPDAEHYILSQGKFKNPYIDFLQSLVNGSSEAQNKRMECEISVSKLWDVMDSEKLTRAYSALRKKYSNKEASEIILSLIDIVKEL